MAQLERLRYFVTVAEELHFGHAAARLLVAQPSLSQQIRRLEQEVGVPLFDRSPRGLRLTVAGQTLLERIGPVLLAVDDAVAAARADGVSEPQRLEVGYLPGAVGLLMGDVLRVFATDHPRTVVGLHEYDYRDPSAGLRSGSTELAFVRMPIELSGLRFVELGSEPRVLAVPVGHPLALRDVISVREALDEPWIVMPAVDRRWREFYLASDQRDRPPLLGPEVSTTDASFEAVIAGQGVMLTEPSISARYAGQGLVSVPVHDVPPSVGGVVWRVGRETAAVRMMVAAARARAAALRCPTGEDADRPQAPAVTAGA
jgi:DNA-binding transcriptional LysR family regulator